jgi:hypothetical protein
MFKQHPKFTPPEDKTTTIWRYVNINKFVSMLDTSSLWFARADQFKDNFEGSSPRINVSSRKLPTFLSEEDSNIYCELMKHTSDTKQRWLRYVAINCWHMDETESTAMWELYLSGCKEGVAIKSSFAKLKDSLRNSEPVYIGVVKYIDFEHQVIEGDSVLAPYIYKRNVFQHEKELRAIIVRSPPPSPKGLDFSVKTIEKGILVPVDLNILIEKVYVVPGSPRNFTDIVKSLIKSRGFNFQTVSSSILNNPKY